MPFTHNIKKMFVSMLKTNNNNKEINTFLAENLFLDLIFIGESIAFFKIQPVITELVDQIIYSNQKYIFF